MELLNNLPDKTSGVIILPNEVELTPSPCFLILFKPVVQFDSLSPLHRDPVEKMLREMALVQPRLFHYLSLRDRVLIHVSLDGLRH